MQTILISLYLSVIVFVVAHLNSLHLRRLTFDVVAWWSVGFGAALEIADVIQYAHRWDWGHALMTVGILLMVMLHTQDKWRRFFLNRRVVRKPPQAPRRQEDEFCKLRDSNMRIE